MYSGSTLRPVYLRLRADALPRPVSASNSCRVFLDQQAIDTTTPMGKLVFQVTGAFAEFERSMIRQRVKAGLKRAVAQGTNVALERKAQKQLAKGTGILKVAKMLGLGTGTVQRIKLEMGAT
jgi:DNA invertase Pin-like site-specific DNA recombinase